MDSSQDAGELVAELLSGNQISVRRQVLGAQLTTFAIGGPVEYLLEPGDERELVNSIKFLGNSGQSYRVLGGGSNLLISDSGLSDWVVRLGSGFRYVRTERAGEIVVGGATSLMSLSREMSESGYSGLEFAGGIPASVGGAVRMNAGAHGSELSEVLTSILLVRRDGSRHEVAATDLPFAYRTAGLPADAVVIEAKLKLVAGDPARSRVLRAEYLAERKRRQPLTMPSAGSVFRNPSAAFPAGRLIEEAGLKGRRAGGAMISELHGNWIVNPARQALAADVLALMGLCRDTVHAQSGILLEPEIVCWPAV